MRAANEYIREKGKDATMDMKESVRIQNSILNSLEKRALVYMAERMPAWVTSDLMTFVGMVGSVMTCIGFILSKYGICWLWLSIAGLVVNWFGDSLDGTIARVRHAQRPIYGYYLDHTMDVVNEILMFVGLGFSPLVHLNIALAAFICYLALTLNVSMNSYLRGEFKLTYAKFGPTEFRLIIIFVCLLFLFVPAIRNYACPIHVLGNDFVFGIFDFIAIFVTVVLAIMWLATIIGDIRYYAKVDPPKKQE